MSKLEEVKHEMLVFLHPRVSSRVSGFACGVAVTMGEVAKRLLCEGFKFRMYWTVGSVRLAVCKDMARVRLR